ncbi:MAG TPA: ParB N-terminal domain-containing protein [Bradyrhizobium sp.]
MLPIEDVIANPRNDRIHPREQIALLAESVKRFGQPRPILVRADNRMIIAGHGVHQAMDEAGEKQIDVLLWEVDQKTADAYLLADNRFAELSHSDPDRRRALLDGMDGEDARSIGFLPDEVQALLDAEDDPILVKEIDTEKVYDRFWINIQGPVTEQAKALQRLQQAMADLPEVEVELGTIGG